MSQESHYCEMTQKIALVLSSGGARGLAHIGVIEALEEHGFEIASISGSSIGAVVGAFHATGQLGKYKEWALNLDRVDVFKLIDFTFSVQGFIKGERVFKAIEAFIPDQLIEEMSIPFSAVATDIRQKKEYVFSSGSMYTAIKASVAIPTVVKPVMHEGTELIDGGVLNPVPVEHVQRTPNDLLVVSNVNALIPYVRGKQADPKRVVEEVSYNRKIQAFLSQWNKFLPGTGETVKKLGFFDILNESIDLMQDKLTYYLVQKHHPELLINISRDACSTFEFYRAAELIQAGRDAVEALIKSNENLTAHKPKTN